MARLENEQLEERLAGLEGWERSGEAIEKGFERGDFGRHIAHDRHHRRKPGTGAHHHRGTAQRRIEAGEI